jgi:signal transduction histidine kinase
VTDTPLRVLIVEDSETDTELMLRVLRKGGFAPQLDRVETAVALRDALGRHPWDVVLSDYALPAFDALAALAVLQQRGDDVPFIVVSGSVGEDTAVGAMQAGATDYVMKDRLQRLAPAVERAIAAAAVRGERRELGAQLQQSQKMEAVGRLAGGVAHDFNNMLTAILGSVELLLGDTGAAARGREELEIIREAATRAQDLIRQLLAFSSRQVLRPAVLDLNHLVGNVGKMLRRVIGEDVHLSTTLATDLGAVRADPGQLEQILVNLAVNARDAMPGGGELTIATTEVEYDLDHPPPISRDRLAPPPGPYVVLQVSDTGVGMSHEVLAHLFEPFFTTKPRGRGTGLGLATVYGIVHQSGGHIMVESAPDRGATFRIYLPRVDGPLDALPGPGEIRAPVTGTETVLLTEDDPLVRLLARTVLERAGYAVLAAAGGKEALILADDHRGPIHLLLTDVVMPEMSGRELMHHLAERRPEVKVLYVTGYSEDAVAQHGVLDPGTAFLPKPFTPEVLTRKVREVLDGR